MELNNPFAHEEEKKGSILGGILGALLGAAIGAFLWTLIGMLGYIASIVGFVIAFLASKGYDVQFGARPLKRAIQNYLEDSLSEQLVDGHLQPGDTLRALLNEQQDAIEIQQGQE